MVVYLLSCFRRGYINRCASLNRLFGFRALFSPCSKLVFIKAAIALHQTHPEANFLNLVTGICLLFHLFWSRCNTGCHTHAHTQLKGFTVYWQMQKSIGNVDCFISLFQGLMHVLNVCSAQLSAPLLSHQDRAILYIQVESESRPDGSVTAYYSWNRSFLKKIFFFQTALSVFCFFFLLILFEIMICEWKTEQLQLKVQLSYSCMFAVFRAENNCRVIRTEWDRHWSHWLAQIIPNYNRMKDIFS